MYKVIASFFLVFFIAFSSFAQTTEVPEKEEKASLDNGSIKSQFDYMMKKSSRYQEYKVIKLEWINKFQSNVQDSLKKAEESLNDSNQKNQKQAGEINALKKELQTIKKELDDTVKAKDSMSLLGLQLSKSSYNLVMWMLILVLLAFAGICYMLFKRSNVVTVETKNTLEDLREEFETHRKNALVREQKLARRLQDEVIKNKNLGL